LHSREELKMVLIIFLSSSFLTLLINSSHSIEIDFRGDFALCETLQVRVFMSCVLFSAARIRN
jgi:hypothetical protein